MQILCIIIITIRRFQSVSCGRQNVWQQFQRSFVATLIPASFLLFIDIPFAYHSFKKYITREVLEKIYPWRKFKNVLYILTAVFLTLVVNPFHSEAIERVNRIEFFTSHVTDIYDIITENLDRNEMKEEEILEILDDVAGEETPVADPEIQRDRARDVI